MIRLILLCVTWVVTVGCSRFETEYGEFAGGTSESSINGLGMLRRSFENAQWDTNKLSRLSERADGFDVIVWTPADATTLYDDAREWFEDWLAGGTRTLVYIVPDAGTELAYLDQARRLAPPEQQLEYRRRMAQLQSSQMISHLQRGHSIESGWFVLDPLPRNQSLSNQSGARWNLASLASNFSADARFALSGIQFQLDALPQTSSTGTSGTASSTALPSSFYKYQTTASAATELKLKPLLATDQGSVLVAKLTSSDWGSSQVLVISGGSLVGNYSLTKPLNQELVANLLQECSSRPGKLGYLATGFDGANVKAVNQEISQTLGLETLTTWPLNVIMLNLVLVGFFACMILLPIFGRPKRILKKTSHDFADHLDAVAALMYQSGGELEARRRISDYMRRVRGEQSGPWVLAKMAVAAPILQKSLTPITLKATAQQPIELEPTAAEPVEITPIEIGPVKQPITEFKLESSQTFVQTNPSDPPLKDAT